MKYVDDETFINQCQSSFGAIKAFGGVHHNQYSYFIDLIRSQSINDFGSDLNYDHLLNSVQNGPHIKGTWSKTETNKLLKVIK